MAYNIGALRRAMRSNPRGRQGDVEETTTSGGVKVSSNGRRRKARRSTRRPVRNARRRVTANRRRSSRRRVTANPRRRRRSRRRMTANRRRSRRSSRRRVTANRRRRSRRSSRRRMTANLKASSYRGKRAVKAGDRVVIKGGGPKTMRAANYVPQRGDVLIHGPNRLIPKSQRRGTLMTKGRKSAWYFGRRRVTTGGKYGRRAHWAGSMPGVARVRRSSKHRSGRPSIVTYPYSSGLGRLSRRPTSRRYSKAKGTRMHPNKRRRSSRRSSRRRRTRRNSARYVVANRRRSRRRSSRRRMTANRRRSRRGSRRRSTLLRNMLAQGAVKWQGRGRNKVGRGRGQMYQLVEYGPNSRARARKGRKKGKRLTGYPVLVPASVSERAYVRKFHFGGAARDKHERAKTSGYAERKKYARIRLRKNRRRTSMRRNPKYIVANRRRRRVRRNQFFGADLMKDVFIPVIGGTAGFVAARVLSNGLANIEGLRNILDSGRSAAEAENTKIAANVIGILATLGLGSDKANIKIIKAHRGALVTGMGLALADRFLGKLTGDAAGYLSGMGEYVTQPLGEYVNQPLGEYVNQPLGGLGAYAKIPGEWEGYDYATAGMGQTLYAAAGLGYAEGPDPANQAGVDAAMDQAEGGVMQAAAGMGQTLYAAAGLGAEADSRLARMYARNQPPFQSDYIPTSMALPASENMPFGRPVPDSLVTPEGKGYAGGLFARNLFAGMF